MLDDNEEKSNESFFDKENGKLEGGEGSNSFTKDLEAQQAEDLKDVEKATDDDDNFQIVNEEDVATEEETKTEEEVKTEEEEVKQDPQLTGIMDTLGQLTELQKQQIAANQKEPVQQEDQDPEPELDYSDPENVKNWTAWNNRQSERNTQNAIAKYHNENVLPMQNITLNRENESQIGTATKEHGERFDWKRDEGDIRKVQESSPSLSISDAFRHVDYNRLRDETTNKVEKATELANSAGVNSGAASSQSKKVGDPITLVATKDDREMAKNFGMDIKDWMKNKYEHENNKGASLI